MKDKLQELYLEHKNQYLYYRKISQYFVAFRTIILFGYIALVTAGIKIPAIKPYFMILFVFITVIFILICLEHNKIRSKENNHKISQEIIEEYFKRIDNQWQHFHDTGIDLVTEGNHIMFDLDIVGEKSLFQYLNIAKSEGGRKELIKKLSGLNISKQELFQNQQAIKELSDNLRFAVQFQVMLRKIKGDLSKQCTTFEQKTHSHKVSLYINMVISAITLILGIMSLLSIIDNAYFCFAAVIQLSFAFIIDKLNDREFEMIKKCSLSFKNLFPIFKYINQQSFQSELLKEIQNDILNGEETMSSLNKIYDLNSCRNHFLGYILTNSILPLNTYILYSFDKTKEKSLNTLKDSISSFELLESLISLSVIGVCKENICMPVFIDDIQMTFDHIKHPLLNETECISNSFCTDFGVNIITGSNMSGKTSFMRTVGMNLILMYAGTFVNASSFCAPYMKIFTSMRVNDDIDRGISTFYGELLRIKDIIEYLNEGLPFIVFIDEIFKGTNYNDRIYGAKEVISKINKENSIVFITTHDFELCNSENISNYYFEEYYEDNKIKFDYKIKKGQCKTTNAKFLMKELKII